MIPGIMTLRTLGDVRAFMRRIPKDRRSVETWQVVQRRLEAAASGGDVIEVYVALQMVLQLECVPCRLG
jgi:hypothetical protein